MTPDTPDLITLPVCCESCGALDCDCGGAGILLIAR